MGSQFPYRVKMIWPENWNFRFSGTNLANTTIYWWKPWLIDNVGKEYVDWSWDIRENDDQEVEFGFIKENDCTLFTVVWNNINF